MVYNGENLDLFEYVESFKKLQSIAYKDITVNEMCIRILGIHFMNCGRDWHVRKHKHSFFEFHYVTRDNVYTATNNIEHNIKAGWFYLLPPGTFHSHRQDPGTSHIGFVLRWEFVKRPSQPGEKSCNTSELGNMMSCLSEAHSFPLEDDGTLIRMMKYILDMAETDCGVTELQMAFCQMIMKIGKFYAKNRFNSGKQIDLSSMENNIIRSAIRFIEENYNHELDVYDISSSVHVSYSHLSRLFRRYTGETVNSYLKKLRLGKSQVLLLCSDKSIAQIAREVGFNSENYFSSAFKKAYSISPSSYRKARHNLLDE